MSIIEVKDVSRSFKVAQKESNFLRYMFSRKYKTINAVNNINFNVDEGELIGFIGPNGAGKSTTIKMMAGILVPTSGQIKILGNIPYKQRQKNAMNIGVIFGQRSQLWWDLPVIDTFQLLKKIYKIDEKTYNGNVELYGEILGIKEFYNQPVRQLSLGQRMRADLCASLLHNPKILFLDEPTIGLDVVVKKQIRNMIKEIRNSNNVTVILTTHDMKDIEEICNRIILIDKGNLVIDLPTTEIKNRFRDNSIITITFDKEVDNINIPGLTFVSKNMNRYIFSIDNEHYAVGQVLAQIMQQYKVIDVSIKESEIDDIICNLYNAGK